MSTCPEKDIHSIYLDGELPGTYVEKYEAHLAVCPECKKQLEKLKVLKAIFEADKNSMELSQKDMDASFERLQARLSFSKHTKSNVVEFKPKAWVSAALGAVAALALVFVPSQLSAKKVNPSSSAQAFTPVANMDIVSPASAVFQQVDGEISSSSVANLFSDGDTFVGNNDVLINSFSSGIGTVSYNPSQQVSYNQNGYNQRVPNAKLASYDIFSPVPSRSSNEMSGGGVEARNVEFSLGSLDFEIQY